MRGLLIRVCIDSACGSWNGPIDIATGRFVYVPIPESQPEHPELRRTFDEVLGPLKPFQAELPRSLLGGAAHFDPDFAFLTYGTKVREPNALGKLWAVIEDSSFSTVDFVT